MRPLEVFTNRILYIEQSGGGLRSHITGGGGTGQEDLARVELLNR